MSRYISMLSDIDNIIEGVHRLSLEEGELFRAAFQKRLDYIELLIQAKRTKASFQTTVETPLTQHTESTLTTHEQNIVHGTTSVTDNDIRFGILRFSVSSDIARCFQPQSKIIIKYRGNHYQGSIPKSVPGRVNGLAPLYNEHPELSRQRRITVQYAPSGKVMTME